MMAWHGNGTGKLRDHLKDLSSKLYKFESAVTCNTCILLCQQILFEFSRFSFLDESAGTGLYFNVLHFICIQSDL